MNVEGLLELTMFVPSRNLSVAHPAVPCHCVLVPGFLMQYACLLSAFDENFADMVYSPALSFVGMMIVLSKTGTLDFVYGGIGKVPQDNVLLFAYLLMFVGFGVKAAIFPLHGWLPAASVAVAVIGLVV